MTQPDDTIYYPTQKLTIEANAHGQRVDNYLMSLLKGVPRSHVYRILRKGEVRVNGGRKKPVYKLKEGDLLRVPPIKIELKETVAIPERVYTELATAILHEDEQILVLNKPSGIAVHSGTGISYGVIEVFKAYHPNSEHLELVHRIDRDTSGCLLLAKGRPVLNELQNAFRSRDMQKSYLALLKGRMPRSPMVVTKSLLKTEISGESMVVVDAKGKQAHSEFVLQQPLEGASWVRVNIKTGRTHQIRVHAQSLGQPLAGDNKYGDATFNKRCKQLGVKRLCLHAHTLGFHLAGQDYQFTAPIPEDIQQLVDRL